MQNNRHTLILFFYICDWTVVFVKVIEFAQDTSSSSGEPICKILMGYQTPRGIINVYLFLLSKFDRKRYELIKYLTPPSRHATPPLLLPPPSSRVDNTNDQQDRETSRVVVAHPVTPSVSSTSSTNSSNVAVDDSRCRQRGIAPIAVPSTTTTTTTQSDSVATYNLPSPPHSLPTSLNHVSSAHHPNNEPSERRTDDEDEYDPDLLFSDLVGYFNRMRQAANGRLSL